MYVLQNNIFFQESVNYMKSGGTLSVSMEFTLNELILYLLIKINPFILLLKRRKLISKPKYINKVLI